MRSSQSLPFVEDDFRDDADLRNLYFILEKVNWDYDRAYHITLPQRNFMIAGTNFENERKNPSTTNSRILNKRLNWKFPPKNM